MSLEYNVYFREQGDSWVSQGTISDLEWNISEYEFDWYTIYEWRVDVYDTVTELTTTGDTWMLTVQRSLFYLERRSDYDEDWTGDVAGGGRYNVNVIAVSYNNIYFGEV